MNGRPIASTSGQYDGDGMCGGCAGPSGVEKYWTPSMRTSLWFSSSLYLRCHHSSRCVTVGCTSKLCTGGGDVVPHSSVRPSHGSLAAGGFFRLTTML